MSEMVQCAVRAMEDMDPMPHDEIDDMATVDRCASELFDWLQNRMTEQGNKPSVAKSFAVADDGLKADLRGIVRVVLSAQRML